jgi:biopolymer transport protein TolR
MSMSTQGSSDPTMSEINVTPLVDVMLVLLIIFMITAPLMQQGVEVDLPQTQAQLLEQKDKQPLELRLDREKKIFIGQTEIQYAELEEKLKLNDRLQREKKMDLAADRSLPYGYVVDIMSTIRRAGIEQVGILTEPPPKEKRP